MERLQQLEGTLHASNALWAVYVASANRIFGPPDILERNLLRVDPALQRTIQEQNTAHMAGEMARYAPLIAAFPARRGELEQLVRTTTFMGCYIRLVDVLLKSREGRPSATALVPQNVAVQLAALIAHTPAPPIAPAAALHAGPDPAPFVPRPAAAPAPPAAAPAPPAAAAAAAGGGARLDYSRVPAELHSLPFGAFLDKYIPHDRIDVGARLGQGGFKTVYKATIRDRARQPVANSPTYAFAVLDVVQVDDMIRRGEFRTPYEVMWDEVGKVIECANSRLCNVIAWSVTPARQYTFLMDLCEGGSLHTWLNNNPALATRAYVAYVLYEIAIGIAVLNFEKHYLHSDLKADNIFVDRDGRAPKIGDLGAALPIRARAPFTILQPFKAGTPGFVPPDGKRANADATNDTYAYGGIVAEVWLRISVSRNDNPALLRAAHARMNSDQRLLFTRLRSDAARDRPYLFMLLAPVGQPHATITDTFWA